MTTQPTEPADPWAEFQAMTPDECKDALAMVAGYDEALFARAIERTRPDRETRRRLERCPRCLDYLRGPDAEAATVAHRCPADWAQGMGI